MITQRSAVLLCAALLAACQSQPAPRATARPSTSPRPATSSPAPTVVVAVETQSDVLLYRVDADRHATRVGQLQRPRGTSPLAVTLSRGVAPDACVVWGSPGPEDNGGVFPRAVRCYPWGDLVGRTVPVHGRPGYKVALRADGGALAWTSSPSADSSESDLMDDQALVVADYRRGAVTNVRERLVYTGGDAATVDVGCASFVYGVAWAGDRLLLECSGENDYPGGLVLQGQDLLGAPRAVDDEDNPPYNYDTEVVTADRGSYLAVEGEYCEIECDDHQPPEARRAVRVDLGSGRREVIATPAMNRDLLSVSGGDRGIVYVTEGSGPNRCYLRLPGEKHGVLITGLPADVIRVFAPPT